MLVWGKCSKIAFGIKFFQNEVNKFPFVSVYINGDQCWGFKQKMTKKEWTKLLRAAISGDEAAFESVYRLKANVIFSCASKLVYGRDGVEDAVQEIVIRMYKNIRQLRSPEAFNVWLYRIIINTCHSFNLQNKNDTADIDDVQYLEEDKVEYLPTASLEQADQSQRIAEAIERLPERQRIALTMYYYDEMSYKEIAQVLDITTSGVAGNILKAKKALKSELSESVSGKKIKNASFGFGFGLVLRQAIAQSMKNGPPEMAEQALKGAIQSASLLQKGTGAARRFPRKALAIGLSTVLALSLAGVALLLYRAQPPGGQESIYATIQMNGLRSAEHVNPSEIRICITDDVSKVGAWKICSAADESVVCTGEGLEIGEELGQLAPGHYDAVWQLEENGYKKTWARRAFEIRQK